MQTSSSELLTDDVVNEFRQRVECWHRFQPCDRDEIVISALEAFHLKSQTEQINCPLRWLLSAAKLLQRRTQRPVEKSIEEVSEWSLTSKFATVETQESLKNVVSRALRKLTPVQRESLRLHFFEGLSFGETGRLLGMCRSTVKSHVRRGIAILRKNADLHVFVGIASRQHEGEKNE